MVLAHPSCESEPWTAMHEGGREGGRTAGARSKRRLEAVSESNGDHNMLGA